MRCTICYSELDDFWDYSRDLGNWLPVKPVALIIKGATSTHSSSQNILAIQQAMKLIVTEMQYSICTLLELETYALLIIDSI